MRSRPFLAVVAAIGSVVGATLIGAVSTPASTVDAAGTTSAYVALPTSQRLIDTRLSGPIRAGGTISAAVTGAAPLPAAGTVSAAVLNVTVAPPAAPGYWTVWPHTNARPVASNVNIDELQSLSGNVTPNLVTVPVGADGIIDLYTSGGGNVIVDLLGYYTPAASASAGRFQPLAAPTRVLDTRGFGAFRPGETRTFTVPRAAGSSAVAINLTSVTVARGYWQVFANGSPRPATSNLNSPPGLFAVVANQAIVTLDATGSISIFSAIGRRPDHRRRRHVFGGRSRRQHQRALRAHGHADPHRRHARPGIEPTRRNHTARPGLALRSARFVAPSDQSI